MQMNAYTKRDKFATHSPSRDLIFFSVLYQPVNIMTSVPYSINNRIDNTCIYVKQLEHYTRFQGYTETYIVYKREIEQQRDPVLSFIHQHAKDGIPDR